MAKKPPKHPLESVPTRKLAAALKRRLRASLTEGQKRELADKPLRRK